MGTEPTHAAQTHAAVMKRVRQGFRDIAAAREKAGVKPGEPLLGLGIKGVISDAPEAVR